MSFNGSRNLNELIKIVSENIIEELAKEKPDLESNISLADYLNIVDDSPVELIRECVDLVRTSKGDYNKVMAKAIQAIFALLKRHRNEFESFSNYAVKYGIKNNDDFIVTLAKIIQYEDLNIGEVIKKLLNQNVISRHIYIALNKLRYRAQSTLKFRYEENNLSLISLIEPEWSTPRLGSLRQFLIDVHGLKSNEDMLTQKVLEFIELKAK